MDYEVLKPMTVEQEMELKKALGQPELGESQQLLRRAQEKGYIKLKESLPIQSQGPEIPQWAEPAAVGAEHFIDMATGGLATPLRGAARAVDTGATVGEGISSVRQGLEQGAKEYPKSAAVGGVLGLLTPGGMIRKGSEVLTKGASKAGAGAAAGLLGATAAGAGFEVSRGLSQGKKADEVANQVLASLAFDIAGAGAGAVAKPIAKGVLTAAGKGGAKVLASLQKIAPESIEYYAKNAKAVNQAIRERLEMFIPRYVTRFNNQLKDFVTTKLDEIDVLARNDPTMVDPSPILKEAKNQVAKIGRLVSTNTKSRQLNSLKKTVERLEETLDGPISISDLNQVRKDLEEELATVLANTKIGRDTLGQAQESILGATLEVFNKHAPEIAAINKDLKKVIDAQKTLRIGSVFGADDGLTEEKARQLLGTLYNEAKQQGGLLNAAETLDSITGVGLANTARLFKSAQDLAVRDVFSNFMTGRSVLGLMAGAGLGNMVGPKTTGLMGALGLIGGSPMITKPLVSGAYKSGRALMDIAGPGGGVAGSKVYQQMKEK